MFASLILRQADLATHVDWIEIHFDIYILYIITTTTIIDDDRQGVGVEYCVYTCVCMIIINNNVIRIILTLTIDASS